MNLTEEKYKKIEKWLPRQRGNVKISNHQIILAIIYMAENGCNWRSLPTYFGNWHTVYMRVNRWAKNGIFDKILMEIQIEKLNKPITHISGDSTVIKVHPDGTGALKKKGCQAIGKSVGGWTTKIHLMATDDRTALFFSLTGGQAHDAPEGLNLLENLKSKNIKVGTAIIMDKAYDTKKIRQAILALGMIQVIPSKKTVFYSGRVIKICIKNEMKWNDYSEN